MKRHRIFHIEDVVITIVVISQSTLRHQTQLLSSTATRNDKGVSNTCSSWHINDQYSAAIDEQTKITTSIPFCRSEEWGGAINVKFRKRHFVFIAVQWRLCGR